MCIIAVVPQGKEIPDFKTLHQMWESNPNGAGFMFPAEREGRRSLRVVKQLMSFSAVKRELTRCRDEFMTEAGLAKVDFAIHFRIASAGGTHPELTHPFQAGETVALMHNGHIHQLAYDAESKMRLCGVAPPDSATKQEVLSTFHDESRAVGIPRQAKPVSVKHFKNWVKNLAKRNNCGLDEAERIVRQYVIVEGDPAAPTPPKESDTSRLAQILSRLPRGWQRNDVCHYLVQEAFLRGDRVVIFDEYGLAKIIGEKAGSWLGSGMWVSNNYFRTRSVVSGKDLVDTDDTRVGTGAYGRTPSAPSPRRDITTYGYSVEDRRRFALDGPRWKEEMDANIQARIDARAGAPSKPPGEASEDDGVVREVDDLPPPNWDGDA
jgi:hypothetical protein